MDEKENELEIGSKDDMLAHATKTQKETKGFSKQTENAWPWKEFVQTISAFIKSLTKPRGSLLKYLPVYLLMLTIFKLCFLANVFIQFLYFLL